MNKHRFLFRLFLVVAVLSLMVACRKEEKWDINFDSYMEQPETDPETKAYLYNETYIYWESSDYIRVYPDGKWDQAMDCQLQPLADPRYASFSATGITASDVYYAIYPKSFGADGDLKLIIPFEQEYRNDDRADFTFGPKSWPMVAWGNSGDAKPRMDFHSVCGMVRIQLTAAEAATIQDITFTDCGGSVAGYESHSISGTFTIVNIDKNAPHITSSGAEVTRNKLVFNEINREVGPSKLVTIYLPLPATTAFNAANTNTNYAIRMLVHAKKDSKDVYYQKEFAAKIRRNSISPLRAIEIPSWSEDSGDPSTGGVIGIAGCGTIDRPFLITNLSDMKKVKVAFDMTDPTINGKVITKDTYFRIASSEIVLDNTWEGINGFFGHLSFNAGNATRQSIENNSQHSLFNSIGANGVVEDLTIRGTITYSGTTDFSPFCGVNNGTIDRCRNSCQVTSNNTSVGGICVTNNGLIHNAANTTPITATASNKYAGGICVTNNGVIDGYGTSIGTVTASQAANICHTNNGTVTNCQISLNRSDIVNPFGGLVYLNASTGKIESSEVLGSASSTASIGGICYQNEGLIDQCKIGTHYLKGSGSVGGIAAYQRNQNSAEIRNCYNVSEGTSNLNAVSGVVGGIVGEIFTGTVVNCYCNLEVASANADYYGAIIGSINGGAVVRNCYNGSTMARFCGLSNRMANLGVNCFDITNDLQNCCVYNSANGIITSLTAGSNGSVGGLMYEALNAWVDANNDVTDPKYLRWTITPPASPKAPVFETPISKSKSKKTPTAKHR